MRQVRKVSNGIPYTPPEICEAFKGDCYSVDTGADVWAFAILLYTTLTGNFPWEMANVSDSYYVEFLAWQRHKTTKVAYYYNK
jgi:serine/threonine-protein kinase SBK